MSIAQVVRAISNVFCFLEIVYTIHMQAKQSNHEYIGIAVALIVAVGFFVFPQVISFFQTEQNKIINKKELENTNMNPVEKSTQVKGSGLEAKKGDTVVVHYTGRLQNGTIFDSSLKRKQPFPVKLGAHQVIAGWEEGLVGVLKGEKLTLTIPPEKAYGEAGYPGVIPPNSTLIFDIEIIEVIAE